MVYSLGMIRVVSPYSAAVAAVMGPMEATVSDGKPRAPLVLA